MPRKRIKDKHLPQRVYIRKGSYYYVDAFGKWHQLGKTYQEAMIKWVNFTGSKRHINIMKELFDKYLLEVASQKAPITLKNNQFAIMKLRLVFGEMQPNKISPVHIYQYLEKRGKEGVRAANMEKALLSHVFTKAIEWGIVIDNPCKNVRGLPEKKRKRYVTDNEFIIVRNMASPLIACAMNFAYLSGLRLGDILTLKLSDISGEGISVIPNKTESKTGINLLIEWSPALKECVDEIKSLSKSINGIYLFCSRLGQPYKPSGFKSIWQRTIKKAVKDGLIKERFRFHDLRRKAATDIKNERGIECARQLLGHESQSMTTHYISGQQRVKPVK